MKSRQNSQMIPVFWDVTLLYCVKWFMLLKIKATYSSKAPSTVYTALHVTSQNTRILYHTIVKT